MQHAQSGPSQRMQPVYDAHIMQAKEFLDSLVLQRRQDNVEDGVDTDLLAASFDEPPNKYSAMSLEYFLIHRYHRDGMSTSTALGIQQAFCHYWGSMSVPPVIRAYFTHPSSFRGDGRFAGSFQYNEESDTVYGCPARAPSCLNLLRVLKLIAGARALLRAVDVQPAIDLPQSRYPSERLATARYFVLFTLSCTLPPLQRRQVPCIPTLNVDLTLFIRTTEPTPLHVRNAGQDERFHLRLQFRKKFPRPAVVPNTDRGCLIFLNVGSPDFKNLQN
ncbi:hypothetical protein DXG01_005918 [Tephrocybe rancida]|nr:hypothetical protein DXG01_005918 [Tephrocybe rancida]